MKIAIVSAYEEAVPPQKYGGTELVVHNLTEELVKLGHDVTLLATGDSKTSAHLLPIFRQSIRSLEISQDLKMRDAIKYVGTGKTFEYLKENNFDIVHQHQMWRFLPFIHFLKNPVITTLHVPLNLPNQQVIYKTYRHLPFISISQNQRQALPELNFIANVYNGIDVSRFTFFPKPKNYYAFLGRMSPEKGPVQAIQIAKKAGVQLIMAAKIDTVDLAFFEHEVKPLIDNEQIRFIGEVDHPKKVELLGNAKALIAPIQWEEPFGLYFVEAMICGTPVITMKRGSAPEIILDGKTGFICMDTEQAASKIKYVDSLKRADCATHVNQHFSADIMAKNYLSAYEYVLKKQK